MENYPRCLFYLEFSIAPMHKPLTNQNTAFLCERNYGKFSRLRAGRIIYITFSLRPAHRLGMDHTTEQLFLNISFKAHLHDQIFFDKFHMSNVF